MTACNFTCNVTSTVCSYTHVHVITRIFVYLHVRCVDTACNVRVHVTSTRALRACNAAIPLTSTET